MTCLTFADVSLDADTGRTGKVKKGSGDKVRRWVPRECGAGADRQTWVMLALEGSVLFLGGWPNWLK